MTKTIQNINDNKWKYISFALMAIIAVPTVSSVTVPQAYADTLGTILSKINDVYNKIITNLDAKVSTRATQTSVNTLQTTDNAIKAKTDNLPSDPASNSHIDAAIASIPSGGGSGSNCVTIDVNRDNAIDKYEISPRPHSGVNWANCNLFDAVLTSANLSGANLSGANLSRSDLINTNLSGANLSDTSLRAANLSGADLSNADLSNADLRVTNFEGADLTGITSSGCTGTPIGTPSAGTLPTCS